MPVHLPGGTSCRWTCSVSACKINSHALPKRTWHKAKAGAGRGQGECRRPRVAETVVSLSDRGVRQSAQWSFVGTLQSRGMMRSMETVSELLGTILAGVVATTLHYDHPALTMGDRR